MTDMVEVPPQRPHSNSARFIDNLVHLCAIVPYSLAALVLRLVMARIFFVTGQEMIDGPKRQLKDIDYALTLPAQVREETFRMFEAKLADMPLSPKLLAYLVSYADFVLPILLVLGLATRFTALALIFLVIFIDQYLEPGTFWSLHIYWYAILLMLMSGGAGIVSVDYLIRRIYDR
jgi:putative oxidoreductase